MASKRIREGQDDDEPPRKKGPKMFDGTYYILKENDDVNETNSTKNANSAIAKCVLCTVKPTFIKGNFSSTGNFYKHFKHVHADRLEELRAHCDSKTKPALVKKNEKLQTILPFANVIDPLKVSTY